MSYAKFIQTVNFTISYSYSFCFNVFPLNSNKGIITNGIDLLLARVVQWIEQVLPKHLVGGSSPSMGAIVYTSCDANLKLPIFVTIQGSLPKAHVAQLDRAHAF